MLERDALQDITDLLGLGALKTFMPCDGSRKRDVAVQRGLRFATRVLKSSPGCVLCPLKQPSLVANVCETQAICPSGRKTTTADQP
jgi:hypothetical protein